MLKSMNNNNNNNKKKATTGSSQLLIQCGGYGNLQKVVTLLERITHSDQFKAYFTNWKQSWYFAKPDDTVKLLKEIGYVIVSVYLNCNCHLHNLILFFSNLDIYFYLTK
jgi:hypothetical protein